MFPPAWTGRGVILFHHTSQCILKTGRNYSTHFVLALVYISAFFIPRMVYSIFTPSSLLAEACGRLWELPRRTSQFVGSDMAVYICVNIGIGGRGVLIESNWFQFTFNWFQFTFNWFQFTLNWFQFNLNWFQFTFNLLWTDFNLLSNGGLQGGA